MQRREKELRCFCRSEPLLATYGLDRQGKLFVRIKVYKGSRIYNETVFYGGLVKIKCRNCLRWQRVNFRADAVQLSEAPAPEAQATDT